MSKVYVFLAEGFEEIEGLTVVDVLRRGGVEAVTVSVSTEKRVMGSHGIAVEADRVFEAGSLSDADLYVLPGGMPGTKHLAADSRLEELFKWAKAEGRRIAAICAAPSALAGWGLLEGEKATANPNFMDKLAGAQTSEEPVVVSGPVTTSRGMGTSIPFALCLLEQLEGAEKAAQTALNVVWTI